MNRGVVPSYLIRIGLAFVFIYAAISGYTHPDQYIYYFPEIIRQNFPAELLLKLFGLYEVALSVWLLSGFKKGLSALFASLTIFAITVVNIQVFAVVFRNVAIFFATLALVSLDWEGRTLTPPKKKRK